MKFLHAADIHLDSPLRGLERYEGAPVDEIRQATRHALTNLVDWALESDVSFVLLAGDLYDGDWNDYNTGLFFVKEMARLKEADIRVFLISGNHDAANKMTRSLRLPDNVHHFSHKKVESIRLEDLGVAIHGRSFGKAAETDNLALEYPAADWDAFNIGLLHTSLTGSADHDPYAPCSLDDLRQAGYDYWALGHVHTRSTESTEPLVVFPGNTQGRHVRETGEKGCYQVTVENGSVLDTTFRPLDVFRWARCEVDLTAAESAEDAMQQLGPRLADLVAAADDRPVGARVVLGGATSAHATLAANQPKWAREVQALALNTGGGQLWIESVKVRTRPPSDAPPVGDLDGPVAEILDSIRRLRDDDDAILELAEHELGGLRRKLDGVLQPDDELTWTDTGELRELLDDMEPLLMSRLRSVVQEGP